MASFKNWDQLIKHLNASVDYALITEVADAVKEIESGAVLTEVYAAYGNIRTGEPNIYDRRKESGGLADTNNMTAVVSNGVLTVRNETPFNEGYGGANNGYGLAELVEYGDGAGGKYDYWLGKNTYGDFKAPRHFTAATVECLMDTGEHIKALKNSLKAQGINVK